MSGQKQAVLWVSQPNRQEQFMAMLPQGVDGARWYEIMKFEIESSKALMKCSAGSIFEAVVQAAHLGLEFSGSLQQAHLIPFGGKCTLIVGYRGLLHLMRQGDADIQTIEARVVREKDTLVLHPEGHLTFSCQPLSSERGEVTGVFALIRYKDGSHAYEVMTVPEVEKIRAMSLAKNSMPWKDHWESMARKTVIRRLAKYVPLSAHMRDGISSLDKNEFDLEAEVSVVPPTPAQAKVLAAIQGGAEGGEDGSGEDGAGYSTDTADDGEGDKGRELSEAEQADIELDKTGTLPLGEGHSNG
ncbi:MAG: recombinase RecT [Planctomycetota bacterium]